MKLKFKPSKPLIIAVCYILLVAVLYGVVNDVLFPDEEDTAMYAEFVEANGELLIKLAENAADPQMHTGILETEEVKDMMAKGAINSVSAQAGGALFSVSYFMPDISLSLFYSPDGQFTFGSTLDATVWTQVEASDSYERWVNGTSYIVANRLNENFFLMEALLPE